jgi:thymidylate synthase (FAD)
MKLIDQQIDIWGETPYNKDDAVLWIERAGRICYRSEDKIVKGSGIKFVNNIWTRTHYSVLEHSNIVIRTKIKSKFPAKALNLSKMVFDSPYFRFCIHGDQIYISGNWRSWIEFFNKQYGVLLSIDDLPEALNNDDYEVVVNPDEIPIELKVITAEFVTNRAVTHELVRHRPASYSQESQRYVRYTKDVSFIKPYWFDTVPDALKDEFTTYLSKAEEKYQFLLRVGLKAEDARDVLPNATATKIVVSANIPEWEHIFNLRVSKAAWTPIRCLLKPVRDYFIENKWL